MITLCGKNRNHAIFVESKIKTLVEAESLPMDAI
jgi:hypothetical protein